MAEEMPNRPNLDRFRKSLDKLVKANLLQEIHKSVGGRGLPASRAYNLCKPATLQSQVSETCDPTVQNPGPYSPKPVTLQSEKMTSELREEPPKGSLEGITEGTTAKPLTGEVQELLRRCRESGDVRPLADRGILFIAPDVPLGMDLKAARAFLAEKKREWIDSLLAESA